MESSWEPLTAREMNIYELLGLELKEESLVGRKCWRGMEVFEMVDVVLFRFLCYEVEVVLINIRRANF